MKIRNVTVRTGRTMPNPYSSYANLRTDITMNADLSDEDDPVACINELQIKANAAVDQDVQRMLDALELKHRARGMELKHRARGTDWRCYEESEEKGE